MKKSVAKSLTSNIDDLHNDGAVDEITMREIHTLCLSDIKEYSAARIIELRKNTRLSQAAFAACGQCFPFNRAEMGKRREEADRLQSTQN